jgi:PKD repeat protein
VASKLFNTDVFYSNGAFMKILLQKLSLLLIIAAWSIGAAYATHYSGGEITWKCVIENGISKYKFKVVVYNDCTAFGFGNGATQITCINLPRPLDATRNVGRLAGASGTEIITNYIGVVSIAPDCSFGTSPALVCNPEGDRNLSSNGTLAKYTYESAPIDFYGLEPPVDANTPFIFAWTNCCRDDEMQNMPDLSLVLRTKMFPYKPPGSTVNQPVDQCFDSSPDFSENPSAMLYNSSQFYTFNNNAIDPDLDDLAYDYACPGTSVPALSAADGCEPPELIWKDPSIYSSNNPFGFQNPSFYSLNSSTGEFTFRPLLNGRYVSCFKVTAKKCDQVVCEIYRDFMAVILPPNAIQNQNKFPSVIRPFYNKTRTDTSIIAGKLLRFPIIIRDSLPGVNQGLSTQSLTMTLNGVGMGAGNADTLAGCPYPPCAVVSKVNDFDFTANPGNQPINVTNAAGESFGYGFKNLPSSDTLWFYWPTSCANLDRNNACTGLPSAVYNFVLTAQDNFCSVPGKTIRTFSVTVQPPDFYKSPPIRCINYSGGVVKMDWGVSTGDPSTFVRYEVYRNQTLLGSIPTITTYTYTDPNPGSSPWDSLYYVRAVNLCGAIDEVSPASPIRLQATFVRSNQAKLTWNAVRTPKLGTSSPYYVVLRSPASPVNWQVVSDQDGDSSNTFAVDKYNLCGDTTLYKVWIYDSLGCYSESNVDTVRHPAIQAIIRTDTVCFGTPNTFRIDTIMGGIGPYNLTWKGPESFPGTDPFENDSVSYTFSTPGQKIVTLIATDSKGCKFEIQDTALVYAVPELQINKDSSCANGGVVSFGFDHLGGPAPIYSSITWDINNGQQYVLYEDTGSFGGVGTITSPGKYPLVLTFQDENLCWHTFIDTLVFGESTIEIIEDSAVCYDPASDTLHLQVNYMKPEPNHNTTWTLEHLPGAPIVYQSYATDTADRLPLTLLAGYHDIILGVTVDDPNGCVALTKKHYKLAPYFEVEIDSVCIGDPAHIELVFPARADLSRYRYDWTFGTEVISGVRDPQYIYQTQGEKYFTVTVTDQINGCATTHTDTFTVRDPMALSINVIPACAGEPTQFSLTVGAPGIDTAWRWYIADAYGAYRDTSYLQSPVFLFPPGKGVYIVTASAQDQNTGCWSTVKDTIKVFNQPDIDFYVDENNCTGNVTRFISRVVGSSDPYVYAWDFGDGSASSDAVNPEHIYPAETEFYEVTLVVTNADGCSVPLSKMIKVCDDQQTVIKVPEVFSPGENKLLQMYFSNVENFEMRLYNRWGVEVFKTRDPHQLWDGKDGSGKIVSPGTYVYIIQGNGPKRKNLMEKGTLTVLY